MSARSVLFYTDSRVLGGAEQSMLTLAGALDRERWALGLLLDDAGGTTALRDAARASGLPVRTTAPMPLGAVGARRMLRLAARLRRHRPHVFHAHLTWPMAAKWALGAAVLARVPAIVATVHVVPRVEVDRSSRLQLRALAAGVGRYVAVSGDVAAQLTARFGWPAAKVEVIHNGVPLDRFPAAAPASLREALGAGDGRPLVLTCARLDTQKDHPTLLRSAARLPGVTFALAGEGPERPALEALARDLGVADRVRFLGRRSDVAELLDACDVFALPSWFEGSSLAVLEAMAAGRAVVTTDIPGTDELVEDGVSGVLVPHGDAGALAGAVGGLLGNPARREALGRAARERVRREFTPERMATRVAAIYERLLAGAQR